MHKLGQSLCDSLEQCPLAVPPVVLGNTFTLEDPETLGIRVKIIVADQSFIIIRMEAPGKGVKGQGRFFFRDDGQKVIAEVEAAQLAGACSVHTRRFFRRALVPFWTG